MRAAAPNINDVLNNPDYSDWLKSALSSATSRPLEEAVRDSTLLLGILKGALSTERREALARSRRSVDMLADDTPLAQLKGLGDTVLFPPDADALAIRRAARARGWNVSIVRRKAGWSVMAMSRLERRE